MRWRGSLGWVSVWLSQLSLKGKRSNLPKREMGISEMSSVCLYLVIFLLLPGFHFPFLGWTLWRKSLCTIIVGLFCVIHELFLLWTVSFIFWESVSCFSSPSFPSLHPAFLPSPLFFPSVFPFSLCLSPPSTAFFFFFLWGAKVRSHGWHSLGKWSTTELYPQSPSVLDFCHFINSNNKNVNSLKYKTYF